MNEADIETTRFVLRLELEEARDRTERVIGKARAHAAVTDEQSALQEHMTELQRSMQILDDRNLAQSISNAMSTDDNLLAFFDEMERTETTDRSMAMDLSPGTGNTHKNTTGNGRKHSSSVIRSSKLTKQRIASTSNPSSYLKDECAVCMEIIGIKTHLRVPCGHFYDEKCLVSLVQRASTDESTFPPRCCRQVIPRESFVPFLDREVRATFEKSANEFSIRPRDRIYCSNSFCSAFLTAENHNSTAQGIQCPQCTHITCSVCREPAHPNILVCKLPGVVPAIQALLEENRWQRCPECHRVIELTHGCFHITCVCSAQFCYQCAASWKKCKCAHWEERLLLAEAERRVDAEMNDEVLFDLPPPANSTPQDHRGVVERTNISRTNRIEEMTNRIRENHACTHRWRKRSGAGDCGNCGTHFRRYLLHCRTCYIAVCGPCARNRM